jgi:hypothetical protein
MKNKKWLLIFIIALPSMFWLILETSTINSYKLNYYGPKKVEKVGDTSFYSVGELIEEWSDSLFAPKTSFSKFPIFAIQFIDTSYAKEDYRFLGFSEFFSYKYDKIKEIPIFIICNSTDSIAKAQISLSKFSTYQNVFFKTVNAELFKKLNVPFFKEKPYYVDLGFVALIDNSRNIRGYYDGRYVTEIKRLMDEYRHLRLKEEKTKITTTNEIKPHS